eukprot:6189270-Pleurochrysis_carterae.AAC.1
MRLDPTKRMSAAEGLTCDYCVRFHESGAVPLAKQKVSIPVNDNVKKTTAYYRDQLYTDIARWKRGARDAPSAQQLIHLTDAACEWLIPGSLFPQRESAIAAAKTISMHARQLAHREPSAIGVQAVSLE